MRQTKMVSYYTIQALLISLHLKTNFISRTQSPELIKKGFYFLPNMATSFLLSSSVVRSISCERFSINCSVCTGQVIRVSQFSQDVQRHGMNSGHRLFKRIRRTINRADWSVIVCDSFVCHSFTRETDLRQYVCNFTCL